jgi:hypothetical protein
VGAELGAGLGLAWVAPRLVLLGTRPAAAQGADAATAQACPKLAESHRLDPAMGAPPRLRFGHRQCHVDAEIAPAKGGSRARRTVPLGLDAAVRAGEPRPFCRCLPKFIDKTVRPGIAGLGDHTRPRGEAALAIGRRYPQRARRHHRREERRSINEKRRGRK